MMNQYLQAGVVVNWKNLKNLEFTILGNLSQGFIERHMKINMGRLKEEQRILWQAEFFIDALHACGGFVEQFDHETLLLCEHEDGEVSEEMQESFNRLYPYLLYIFNNEGLQTYAEERGSVEAIDRARGGGSS